MKTTAQVHDNETRSDVEHNENEAFSETETDELSDGSEASEAGPPLPPVVVPLAPFPPPSPQIDYTPIVPVTDTDTNTVAEHGSKLLSSSSAQQTTRRPSPPPYSPAATADIQETTALKTENTNRNLSEGETSTLGATPEEVKPTTGRNVAALAAAWSGNSSGTQNISEKRKTIIQEIQELSQRGRLRAFRAAYTPVAQSTKKPGSNGENLTPAAATVASDKQEAVSGNRTADAESIAVSDDFDPSELIAIAITPIEPQQSSNTTRNEPSDAAAPTSSTNAPKDMHNADVSIDESTDSNPAYNYADDSNDDIPGSVEVLNRQQLRSTAENEIIADTTSESSNTERQQPIAEPEPDYAVIHKKTPEISSRGK